MRANLVLALSFALSFLCHPAQAKDFRVHRDWAFPRPAEELVSIISDFEHSCDHGCRHRSPSVERSVVLSYDRTPDRFYVWTSTKDIQDSKWFSRVLIERTGHHAHVDFRMVTEELAKKLEKLSGLENDPATDFCTAMYDLDEEWKDGHFVQTRVSFTTIVRLSGIAAWIGGGIVTSRLEDAAHAVYLDLRDSKAEPHAPAPPAAPSAK